MIVVYIGRAKLGGRPDSSKNAELPQIPHVLDETLAGLSVADTFTGAKGRHGAKPRAVMQFLVLRNPMLSFCNRVSTNKNQTELALLPGTLVALHNSFLLL